MTTGSSTDAYGPREWADDSAPDDDLPEGVVYARCDGCGMWRPVRPATTAGASTGAMICKACYVEGGSQP